MKEREKVDIPFFSHHKQTLNQQPLGYLGSDTLEEAQETLVLDDEFHDFDEALEWFSLSGWWWFGL